MPEICKKYKLSKREKSDAADAAIEREAAEIEAKAEQIRAKEVALKALTEKERVALEKAKAKAERYAIWLAEKNTKKERAVRVMRDAAGMKIA